MVTRVCSIALVRNGLNCGEAFWGSGHSVELGGDTRVPVAEPVDAECLWQPAKASKPMSIANQLMLDGLGFPSGSMLFEPHTNIVPHLRYEIMWRIITLERNVLRAYAQLFSVGTYSCWCVKLIMVSRQMKHSRTS